MGREEGGHAGEERPDRPAVSISVLAVILLGNEMCLGLPYSLVGPTVSWEARNKAVLKYQMAHPALSSAQPSPGHPLHPEQEGRVWRWEIPE